MEKLMRVWPYLLSAVILAGVGGYIAHLRLSPIPDLAIGYSSPPPKLGLLPEKVIDYELTGGDKATASYLDMDARTQDVTVALPWRISLRTRALTVSTGVLAQGAATRLGCRILVDGVVRDERTAQGPHAAVNCNVQVA